MSDTNDAATQAAAVPSHTGEDAQNDVLLDVRRLTKRFAAETNFFGRATSARAGRGRRAASRYAAARRSAWWANRAAARPPWARCW